MLWLYSTELDVRQEVRDSGRIVVRPCLAIWQCLAVRRVHLVSGEVRVVGTEYGVLSTAGDKRKRRQRLHGHNLLSPGCRFVPDPFSPLLGR